MTAALFVERLRRRGQGELLLAGSISIRPHDVKSLTMITDEQPKKFPIRKAAIRVDNDYVAINDHDYILPVSAQVVTRVGENLLKRNDLTFSNFRRFGSTVRIVGTAAEEVHSGEGSARRVLRSKPDQQGG